MIGPFNTNCFKSVWWCGLNKKILRQVPTRMAVLLIYSSTPHILFGKSSSPKMFRCCTLLPFGILSKHITHRINTVLVGEGIFQRHDQDTFKLGSSSFEICQCHPSIRSHIGAVSRHPWSHSITEEPWSLSYQPCVASFSVLHRTALRAEWGEKHMTRLHLYLTYCVSLKMKQHSLKSFFIGDLLVLNNHIYLWSAVWLFNSGIPCAVFQSA